MKTTTILSPFLLLLSIFGCHEKSKKESFVMDGDSVHTTTSIKENYEAKLSNLNTEQLHFIELSLQKADKLIVKYNGKLTVDKYNSKTLDLVLDKWRQDTDLGKNLPEEMIDIIGAAFGQGLVNELDCEWQLLTDEYGQDIAVCSKKYHIEAFPFSSVEKAATEVEPRSLNDIKLTLKHAIQDAPNNAEVEPRK